MYLFYTTQFHNLFNNKERALTVKKVVAFSFFVLYAAGCISLPAPETVTIYRDIYGVPHIVAKSDEGVFFGMGYVQAQDHLEQMLKNFAQAAGRLSSIKGKTGYESDVIVNLLNIPEIAHEQYNTLSPDARNAIERFCNGINKYIKENKKSLPEWTKEVDPEEVVAFSKYAMLSRPIGRLKQHELRHIKGKSMFDLITVPEDLSNEWVISPQKSASGDAIIQADPHLPWEGLNQWYEVHLKGETINVAGATLFGLPTVIIGFNEHIAWTMTANSPDTADVYQEKIKKEGTKYFYQYDNEWKPIEEKRVEIRTTKEKEITLYYTHHGPVIAFDEKNQIAYTAKLSTCNEVGMIDQMLLLNKASNLSEFKKALSLQQFVRWNIVYGDVDGNIFYIYNARVGVRDETYDWSQPVPGWTSDTEWKGVYPFDQLPQSENPEEGFFQNCNVAPWFINGCNDIRKEYPEYLVPDKPMNKRGQRATHLLSQDALFTIEDMMSFSLDTYSLLAEEEVQSLLQIDESFLDDKTKEALNLVKAWDLKVEKDSRESLLFITWLTMNSHLNEVEALTEAVQLLEETYGRYDVLWGDVHVIRRGDIYPLSGSHFLQTLFMTGGQLQQTREYCDRGSSYLLLVELGTLVEAWSVRPLGQSEDLNSPHYADMTELYSRNQYKQFFFTEEDILNHIESEVILEC